MKTTLEDLKNRRSCRAYKPEQITDAELDAVLEDDGWLLGSGQEGERGFVELELEDEKMNPKYGIMAVKNYLQKAGFDGETTMELNGAVVGIFE